jgi:uncharacterized membrane protein
MTESGESKPENIFQPLVEWSKWLITINFLSATGCIITLQETLKNPSKNELLLAELLLAVLFFCVSVGMAVYLIFTASLTKINPTNTEDSKKKCVKLAETQLACIVIALTILFVWVVTKASINVQPKDDIKQTCCIMCSTANK